MDQTRSWDVISVYTRSQAIEDGMLVDVTKIAQVAGFKLPTAISKTLLDELGSERRIEALLTKFYLVIAFGPKQEDSLLVIPNVIGKDAWLHVGSGDNGEQVLTLMRPEDW